MGYVVTANNNYKYMSVNDSMYVDILTPRSMELFEYSILTMLRLTTARIEANIVLTVD